MNPAFKGSNQTSLPRKRVQEQGACELIHMDVCGPMTVMSTGGSKYFYTFLDDYFRPLMAVPISKESDVKETVPDILAE